MSRRLVVLVGVVAAAVAVTGTVAVAVHREPRAAAPSPAPATTTTTVGSITAPPSPPGESTTTTAARSPASQALLDRVPALQEFVARERGLAFTQPVDVELLDDAAFRKRVGEIDEEDVEELRSAAAVLQAMGLLRPGTDLVAVVRRFSEQAIVGYYDPETKELVVRGASVNPYVLTTLVHELVHALEDQHFDLDRPDLGDEASLGFDSLAEGSALRIEDRYVASLSPADRRAAARAEAAQGGTIPNDIPDVIQIAFSFPYVYGSRLVASIVRAGGQRRLDAAFGAPPASSEQVLHPQRYLRPDQPRPVPVPPAEAAALDDGEIGELFLLLMLRAELDDGRASAAARGWGGDAYVAWRSGQRTCVRMDFVMDTPADTGELAAALRDWASRRGRGARASGTSLTTCG